LLEDARMLAAHVIERDGQWTLDLSERELGAALLDRSERVLFVVQNADGTALAGNASLAPAPPQRGQRWTFDDVSHDGADLRQVTLRPAGADRFAVVLAHTTRGRQDLLERLGLYSRLPQFALLLLLGAWLYRSVGRELAQFESLEKALERRDSSALTPLRTDAPSREVQQVAQAINDLMLRIERGIQAQREFTGNVAHELRTPLAGIRALAEYGLAQSDPEVWRAQLSTIAASEERASRLVDQLLALALADETRDVPVLVPLAVDEIVRNTALAYLAHADALKVDLGAVGLDRSVHALGNSALVEGALNNLIDNALRYGRPGPGQPAAVTVEVERHDGCVEISVSDNGPGMDETLREKVLRRWERGGTGAQLGAGAGLGLAIVTRYAALMGGRLNLSAAPGGGLRATLSLQATEQTSHSWGSSPPGEDRVSA